MRPRRTSLASLGIAANPQGTYDTNSTTLGNALKRRSGLGHRIFRRHRTASPRRLNTLISQYTQAGGLLRSINQGLQSSLTDVANQQTALNAHLATYSATLTTEYNAMDTAVALLKQTQTYLTAEFNPNSRLHQQFVHAAALSSGNLEHRRISLMMYGQSQRRLNIARFAATGWWPTPVPTRLVQIMFEHILSHLATARGAAWSASTTIVR